MLEVKHRELKRLEKERIAREIDGASLSEKVGSLDINEDKQQRK